MGLLYLLVISARDIPWILGAAVGLTILLVLVGKHHAKRLALIQQLIDEANVHLPHDKKFGQLGWGPQKYTRLFRAHRAMYPSSPLIEKIRRHELRTGLTFTLVVAAIMFITGDGLVILPSVGLLSLVTLFGWYYYGSFLSK